MANQLQRIAPDPEAASAWRLTDTLDAKLSELSARGYEIAWIESSVEDITRLVMEGGEAAIQLDPDPAVDRAWYKVTEIRHSATRQMTWIFVRGEVASGELSAHVIAPPDPI